MSLRFSVLFLVAISSQLVHCDSVSTVTVKLDRNGDTCPVSQQLYPDPFSTNIPSLPSNQALPSTPPLLTATPSYTGLPSTGATASVLASTSGIPKTPVLNFYFYLRTSSTPTGATTYAHLLYGGKTGGRRKRSDFWVIDFTTTVSNASLFLLDPAFSLASGNYTAALPYGAKRNTQVQFLPTDNVKLGQASAITCAADTVSAIGNFTCADHNNTNFMECDYGFLHLGSVLHPGCRALQLVYQPVLDLIMTSSSSVSAGPTTIPNATTVAQGASGFQQSYNSYYTPSNKPMPISQLAPPNT